MKGYKIPKLSNIVVIIIFLFFLIGIMIFAPPSTNSKIVSSRQLLATINSNSLELNLSGLVSQHFIYNIFQIVSDDIDEQKSLFGPTIVMMLFIIGLTAVYRAEIKGSYNYCRLQSCLNMKFWDPLYILLSRGIIHPKKFAEAYFLNESF